MRNELEILRAELDKMSQKNNKIEKKNKREQILFEQKLEQKKVT